MKTDKTKDPNVDQKGNFIFRWELNIPKKKKCSKDPFRDFVKDLLKEILDIVMLTYKGKDVKVDGFRFLNSLVVHKLKK